MNKIVLRWIGLGLSVTALATIGIVSNGLSAQAETLERSSTGEASPQLPEEIAKYSLDSTPISADSFLNAPEQKDFAPVSSSNDSTQVTANEERSLSTQIASKLTNADSTGNEGQFLSANVAPMPVPGSTATSATSLTTKTPSVAQTNQPVAQSNEPEVAQLPVDPGRATRGGSSYVGVGGNIGLSGDTALGDGNFTIISKIGLTRNIAVRPSVVLGNDATFLIPLTYDFSIRQAEALEEVLPIAPYVGAGVSIATGDNDNIGLLLTGGIDVPLNSQFTANAAVNVGIADETDVGLAIGVGYNFAGLGI